MSVTSFATELRKAAPLGVTASERSMAQTFASRSGALGPVIRTSARPCVASKTLTSPSSCTCSTRPATAALVPGVASKSHSPGPEPTTSVPCASRAARPKGTPSARASSPSGDASTRILARGVQSVIFSSAALRRALTSQPRSMVMGGTGAMGLRAMGAVSTTLARPVGVIVRVVRRDGGRDALSAEQLHGYLRPRRGEVRGNEAKADRTPQCGRHATRRYPPHDLVLTLHDLARLRRDQRAVVRLQADEPKSAVAVALPRQLGLACEVVLFQLDHPAEANIVGACEPVGVLAYDKMSLLQAQDTLGLYAEGPYPQIRAVLQERLPHVQPVGGGHVDLVAELASKADAPHKAAFDAGDASLANPHVGKDLRREVHALGQAQEQLAGLGPSDVDARIRRGHRIDVNLPLWVGGLQPVVDPLPHSASAGGGRRHDVTLGAEAAGHAVIEEYAILKAHHTVADRADVEVVPPVDVQVVQQLGHVRATKVELPQRRHVYDADVLAYVENFGGGVAVMVGPDPGPRNERLRSAHLVPRLHRRVAYRLEHTSCQGAKGDRAVRGPPHGSTRLLDSAPCGLRHDRHGVDGLELALGRPHGHGCVPLDQLYGVVALLLGREDVLGGDILGVVHDAVRLATKQRWVLVDGQLRYLPRRRLRPCFSCLGGLRDGCAQPPRGRRCPSGSLAAGGARVGELRRWRAVTGDSAARQHVVWKVEGKEASRP